MIGPTVDKNIFDVGTLIADRYEVTRFIGSGAMGWVIQVIDKQLDDRVTALKFLYPHLVHDEVSSSRFRNEVVIAQGLSHPSIVRIHDLGRTEGGQFFISMEFVNGVSLKEFLATQGRPGLKVSTAAKIIFEIAQAIGYAHQNGVVHRDLKPDNIIISDLGAVKLVDFGIARSVWQEHGLTRTGGAVGTPYYMSPEQVNGEKVDYRSDIYALGIIAYELVSGEKPFTEDNFLRLAEQHLEQDIPHLSESAQNVPAWYDEIVQKATKKKKEERFDSALEISHCIEQHIPPGVLSETRVKVVPGIVSSASDDSSANAIAGIVASIPEVATLADFKKRTLILAFAGLFVLLGAATGYWVRGGFSSKSVVAVSVDRPVVKTSFDAKTSFSKSPGAKSLALPQSVPDQKKEPHPQSELHAAVNQEKPEEIVRLIKAGVDVNVADGRGETPLFQALRQNKIEIAKLLLTQGADPNLLNVENEPPLALAIRLSNEPFVKLLIEYGADTGMQIQEQNWSLLHLAVRVDNANIISMLLDQTKTDPNAVKRNGITPLHFAGRFSSDGDPIVRKLVAAGADVNKKSETNLRSPIYHAIENQNLSVVKALIESGADINTQDSNGYSPLMYAVRRKRTEEAVLLISVGADKTITDKLGRTVLEIAVKRGDARLIKLLK